jgi:hypothetical protein
LAQVEGLLISQSPKHVCLILAHSALVLNAEHVVAIEVAEPRTSSGLKVVRVEYKDEAPIPTDVDSSAAMNASRVDNSLPFALAVRHREQPQMIDSPRYRELAMSFLRRHGLIGQQGTDDCCIGA